MNDKQFKHVLCAVRGGRESRNTVVRAIDLALENGAHLTFFHILDAEFLGAASLTMAPMRRIYQQLREMGEFTMRILCDRAERRGVRKVDYLVESGNIKRLLLRIAVETHADVMVMGRPVRSPGTNVFAESEFEVFARKLQEETDPHIIVVTPDLPDRDTENMRHGILPPESD